VIVQTILADYCDECQSRDILLTNINHAVVSNQGGHSCRSYVVQMCVNCGNNVGHTPTQTFLDLLNRERSRQINANQPSLFEGNTGNEF
jgi:RNase P subunit RPR2